MESATDSPFMILTAQVRQEKQNVIPAVTHVDGSGARHARRSGATQTVNPSAVWRRTTSTSGTRGTPAISCLLCRESFLPPASGKTQGSTPASRR